MPKGQGSFPGGARVLLGLPPQGPCAFTLPHIGAFTAEWPVQDEGLAVDRPVARPSRHLGGGGRPGIPPEVQHSGPQGQERGQCSGGSPPLGPLHLQEESRTMRGRALRFTGTMKLPRACRSEEPRKQEERAGAQGPARTRLGPKAVGEHGAARPGVPDFLEGSHTWLWLSFRSGARASQAQVHIL